MAWILFGLIGNNQFDILEGVTYCVTYITKGSTYYVVVVNPGIADGTTYFRFACLVSSFQCLINNIAFKVVEFAIYWSLGVTLLALSGLYRNTNVTFLTGGQIASKMAFSFLNQIFISSFYTEENKGKKWQWILWLMLQDWTEYNLLTFEFVCILICIHHCIIVKELLKLKRLSDTCNLGTRIG